MSGVKSLKQNISSIGGSGCISPKNIWGERERMTSTHLQPAAEAD
jgi:hypothetical protein